MGTKAGEFEVTIRKNEVVAPKIGNQILEHRLPQSNLDLHVPPVNPSSFFCFKKPLDERFTFDYMVGVLKEALAKTLVYYYPLAGEMVQNAAGEPEILCNNRGVEFMEALADVQLKDLNFHNLNESIGGKLVPSPPRNRGLMVVQATKLKCEGLVVGFTVDHRATDAYSANMFTVSWMELAQNKPQLSQIPSFQRSLLLPRQPGHYDLHTENTYVPLSELQSKPANDLDHNQEAISRVYYVDAKKINELQALANNDNIKRTKLISFGAFLWKTIASSTDIGKTCKLGIIVDGRSRIGNGDEKLAESMEIYYGNVVSIPYGQKRCEELKKKPLSWVANEVEEFLSHGTTKEHFLGVIDLVEANRPQPVTAKIYADGCREGPAVVVSSGLRFPVAKMDFGWGLSAFSSYYFPWGGQAGYVVPMPSPVKNGDWIVYMHMIKDQLDFIETEAAQVFKPLTSNYLNFV